MGEECGDSSFVTKVDVILGCTCISWHQELCCLREVEVVCLSTTQDLTNSDLSHQNIAFYITSSSLLDFTKVSVSCTVLQDEALCYALCVCVRLCGGGCSLTTYLKQFQRWDNLY